MADSCKKCQRSLTHDEKALNWKMLNRGATSFFCLACLADYFKVSEENLAEKIRFFKETGCTLF